MYIYLNEYIYVHTCISTWTVYLCKSISICDMNDTRLMSTIEASGTRL